MSGGSPDVWKARRMYDPVKDGVEKSVLDVTYTEVTPADEQAELVHCFWQLRTEADLTEDFTLHAMPDACVNLLFDQQDTAIAGVTALQTTHTALNLGRSFHYVGVQFFPGVWRGKPEGTVDHYVGEPYVGELPLVTTNQTMSGSSFTEQISTLSELVDDLVGDGLVAQNAATAAILANIDDIKSVNDMAAVAGLSTRQLQRTLKATTRFTPHDLLKVLRIQQSFRRDYLLSFADQSHFTHSFKFVTGYTPREFKKTFDV